MCTFSLQFWLLSEKMKHLKTETFSFQQKAGNLWFENAAVLVHKCCSLLKDTEANVIEF